jgi:NAD(P)-dependent dehydrogenase (short-subunit alcohol dehydrogenase family)
MIAKYSKALIVGSGSGLSASLAQLLAREGFKIALAARNTEKLASLCANTGATAFSCDATDTDQVAQLFQDVERKIGEPDVVIYNASARSRGPFVSLVASEVEQAIRTSAFGGFLVAQAAAKRMVPKGHGAILFSGASACVYGYAQSAPFDMG